MRWVLSPTVPPDLITETYTRTGVAVVCVVTGDWVVPAAPVSVKLVDVVLYFTFSPLLLVPRYTLYDTAPGTAAHERAAGSADPFRTSRA